MARNQLRSYFHERQENRKSISLRNKFHFSDVHESINAMSAVQSKWRPYFARNPLRSYFHEPQKNEIHLLYLHYVLSPILSIICEVLI